MANPFLRQARLRATKILRSRTATLWLSQAVFNRSGRLRDRLGEGVEQLQCFAAMLRDWALGRYRQVPWTTVLSVAGALVYFLMPLDAIPDPILAVGLLDDLAVLSRVSRRVRADLDDYRQWRRSQQQQEPQQGGEHAEPGQQ